MKNIQILIVEDSLTQAEELKFILEDHRYFVQHAVNGEIALQQLLDFIPDIIISDIIMPGMDGFTFCSNLKANKRYKTIPVILLTSLSEPSDVIKGLECGADSFLIKPYNEEFLIARINYFVKNAELRKEATSDSSSEVLFANQKYTILSSSRQILDVLLSTYEDSIRKNEELIETNRSLKAAQEKLYRLNTSLEEIVKNRTEELEKTNAQLIDQIEERKRIDEALIEKAELLSNAEKLSHMGSWRFDLINGSVNWSDEMYAIFGIDQTTNTGNMMDVFLNAIHPDDKKTVLEVTEATLTDGISRPLNYRIVRPSGEVRWVHAEGKPIVDKNGKIIEQLGTFLDITERKLTDEALKDSETRYRSLFTEMLEGFALHEIICDDKGLPVDYRFIEVNPAFESMTGLKANEIVGKTVLQVLPNTEKFWIETYGKVALTGQYVQFEHYTEGLDKFFNVGAFSPKKFQFATFFSDVTERKLAELKLKESNELNTSLIKTIPFGIDIVDEKGIILFMSENLTNIFGPEAIGRKCWTLYRDDKTQCADCPLYSGVGIGQTSLYETDNVLGGRTFQISHTGMLYKGQKAMLEIFQDITEQKQAERALIRSEKELRKAQQITHIGSWYLNLATDQVEWTEELYRMYGFDPQLPVPPYSEHMKLFTSESWNLLSESLEKTKATGIPYELELQTIKDDGSNGWMWVRGETDVNKDGKVVGLWGAAQDITERKNIEIEFQNAKEKAEESDRLKSSFLANMSHEIRTPLNSIVGFTEIFDDPDIDPQTRKHYGKIIKDSSVHLLAIVNDILDISKIETGQMNVKFEECNLHKILVDLNNMFSVAVAEKGIELNLIFTGKIDCIIHTDVAKFKQIFTNLISNAIKFTLKGNVDFGLMKDGSKQVFFVKDTGIGIPEDHKGKVFERFTQVESSTVRNYGGTGLGLAISKRLVELLGGEIWLESEVGVGSTFYFILPIFSEDSI